METTQELERLRRIVNRLHHELKALGMFEELSDEGRERVAEALAYDGEDVESKG